MDKKWANGKRNSVIVLKAFYMAHFLATVLLSCLFWAESLSRSGRARFLTKTVFHKIVEYVDLFRKFEERTVGLLSESLCFLRMVFRISKEEFFPVKA